MMWQAISAVWLTLALAMLVNWIVKRFFRSNDTGTVESENSSTLNLVSKLRSDEAAESTPLHKYDVFINHRGPDVKDTLAAHLNAALRKAGFIPFLDAKCIKQGKSVFSSIDGALSGAFVHVAIFSKRYAESKYCLDELLDMLHSGKVVLPVFYDVKPQDLRYIEGGPFAAGFRKHVKRKRHDKIPQWREALQKVSGIMGYEKNGDESELVRNIVLFVRNEMPVNVQLQKRRFGLEKSLEELLERFNMMKDNVNVIGLVGVGGIGKTTLATEFYNHCVSRMRFQYHCFLKDVRSSNSFELQQQLLQALIQEDLQSNSSEEYLRKFGIFSSQKVLLIVDDIDNESQFSNLIPDIQKLGSGSRILITSRHRDVLDLTMRPASSKDIYEVQLLNPIDSRHLFNWHAFSSGTPSPGFSDLAEKVAEACSGHPLALEVIGASLFNKEGLDDVAIWMDAVETLKENEDIHGKLRISYDCLPTEGDKAMFLDIACLLIGMPCEVAMLIWKACYSCGHGYCFTSKNPNFALRKLLDKSLVKLDSGRLSMHDVIRDMGRDIVKKASRKPEERTHLWDTSTSAKVLSKNKRSDSVRGMRLSVSDTDGTLTSKASHFASMEELHLLALDGYPIDPDDFSSWPQELRWLQWKSLPYSELPLQLNLPKLTVLDVTDSGNLTRLWPIGALIEFPLLQRLILTNCRALEELPENIGQSMPRLNTVDMDRCSLIALLPDSLGQLRHLGHLILSECENLKALPDTIVTLVRLQILILNGCLNLRHLPVSMAGLGMLKELHMKRCPVKDLPRDFGQLTSLTSLSMDELHTVSETFGRLESLESLHVEEVPDLGRWFTSSLGDLTALKLLHLCNNPTVTTLPKSFGSMKSLLYLQMVNASALVTIEVLPRSLQHLDLAHCGQLISIPSLAQMNFLVFLDLCNCKSLTQVQGLECLTALENINLSGVTSLSDCKSVVQSGHNRALQNCCVSGSRVGVAFDTKWMERKPALQLISYYDDTIGYFPNGMARKVINLEWCFEFLMGATISSKADCVALMFCVVAHDQGWSSFSKDYGYYNSCCSIEVQIMREGKVVTETGILNLRHADSSNQVYLWTLRREHPVVQSLQFGDRICVYARSRYPGWAITVREGAICVVHHNDDHLTLGINSELLSRSQSEAVATKLSHLVLVDQFHLSLKSELENNELSVELGSLAADKDSVRESSENKDPTVEILPQQRWLIAPAYGRYQWTHSWKLPREGQGCIAFEAQGKNSVHVLISEHCNNSSTSLMYEVLIGGSGNTTSLIQKYNGRGAWLCCSVEAGLSHPEGVNRLWLSIDDRTSVIQVGRGDPGQDVIAVYWDKGYLSTVQNITFTSLGTPLTYSNVVITGVQHIPPVCNTFRLPEKVLQPVVNGKWAMAAGYRGHYTWAQHWTLPTAGRGIISFATDGCYEVYVAISSRPKTLDPIYEILIGGYTGQSNVLRKKSQGPIICQVETGDSFASGINHFWVMIDDRSGTVVVGRGAPGDNMILVYKDADFLTDALYCTFTTWDIPVTYSSIAISEVLD